MPDTIVYFKNGIGNLIMMSPAIQALAAMDESGKIDVCMDSRWKDNRRVPEECILREWDLIGKIVNHPLDEIGEYKTWFYTKHQTGSLAADLFMRKSTHSLLPTEWRGTMIHEEDFYMAHVYSLGYSGVTPRPYVPVANKPLLDDPERPVIGICNGALQLKYWEKKRWPHFKKLAEILKQYCKGTILLVGGKRELDDVTGAEDYTGRLSITETAKLISQVDLFITTDTACMHLADALNVPTIALFGPTLVSKNGPRSERARIIKAEMECAPCQEMANFWGCKNHKCMTSIGVGDVMSAARDLLRGGRDAIM